METLRLRIDEIDGKILGLLSEFIELLGKRNQIVKEIAIRKKEENHPVRDIEREREVIQRMRTLAADKGINPDVATKIYRMILEDSAIQQDQIMTREHRQIKEPSWRGCCDYSKEA